jgi:hypothetical protein
MRPEEKAMWEAQLDFMHHPCKKTRKRLAQLLRGKTPGYREAAKEREKAAAADEYDGDPIEAIELLLPLIHSYRLGLFARECIALEVDRFLEPRFVSQNKNTVEQERFARLQEIYSHNSLGSARKNGFPVT